MKKTWPTFPLLVLIIVTLTACSGSTLKSLDDPSRPRSSPTAPPEPTASPLPTPTQINPEDIFVSGPDCAEQNPHPVGNSIAEKFNVSYDEVMLWYCNDFPFEDILLALQTSKLIDAAPQDLLIKSETHTWHEIWDELGLDEAPTE